MYGDFDNVFRLFLTSDCGYLMRESYAREVTHANAVVLRAVIVRHSDTRMWTVD